MNEKPGPLQKRDILYGIKKVSADDLRKIAKNFEQEGWLSDAVDFLAQAKDLKALSELRARAVQEGDSFLLLKISRQMGESDAPSHLLLQCAERAESLGKNRYALKAFEKLELVDRVAKIRALIANDGDILAEAESTVFIPVSEDEVEDGD